MFTQIVVVGSGIAGLSAAWLLSRRADVTLVESSDRLGGHANTANAETPDGAVAVDTGFIVYNEQNYPNLTSLFAHLQVPTSASEMSFAVSADGGRMEYSGRHLGGIFGQRRNVMRIRHWQMLADILRFFRWAETQVQQVDEHVSIGTFLERFGYSEAFIEDHILPMSAAIWSTPARSMLEFPAQTFIRFFANHGLLQVANRPKWRTVRGGSREYVARLRADGDFRAVTGRRIVAIHRNDVGVELVFSDGQRLEASTLVLACHPEAALPLLTNPSPEERRVLSAFRTTANRAVLHSDPSFMPQRRRLWSAWNYLRTGTARDGELSLSYWMNKLQPLPTETQLFVTLNPMHAIAPDTVQGVVDYRHPLFDAAAISAQREVARLQGERRTWFAGAWLGHGFHEDGLVSGLAAAESIAPVTRPWATQRPDREFTPIGELVPARAAE